MGRALPTVPAVGIGEDSSGGERENKQQQQQRQRQRVAASGRGPVRGVAVGARIVPRAVRLTPHVLLPRPATTTRRSNSKVKSKNKV